LQSQIEDSVKEQEEMEQEIDKIQGGGPDEVETLQKDIV
jgi:hypothetical protein